MILKIMDLQRVIKNWYTSNGFSDIAFVLLYTVVIQKLENLERKKKKKLFLLVAQISFKCYHAIRSLRNKIL
jgi:hypothetical protein